MSLFWISVALSNGAGLVGNALGLTGILISALLVVSQQVYQNYTSRIFFIFKMGRTPLRFTPPHNNIVHEHKVLEYVCLPPPKDMTCTATCIFSLAILY